MNLEAGFSVSVLRKFVEMYWNGFRIYIRLKINVGAKLSLFGTELFSRVLERFWRSSSVFLSS